MRVVLKLEFLNKAFFCCREHDRIVKWEDPVQTGVLLVVFVIACLRLNAEYALCVPLFVIVFLMTRSLYRRSAGELERRVIERPPDRDDTAYKPYAVFRVAVCGFRNFTKKSFLSSNPHPMPGFIKISYLPSAYAPPPAATAASAAGAPGGESQRQTEFVIGIAPVTQNGIGRPHTSASETGYFAPSPGKKMPHATSSIAGAAPSGFSGLLSQLNIISSDSVRDGMLHNMCDPWPRLRPDKAVDMAFVYPMLQPESKKKKIVADTTAEAVGSIDMSWLDSEGAVKFTLIGGNNQTSAFVDGGVLGHIVVPVKELLATTRAAGHKSGRHPLSYCLHIFTCNVQYSFSAEDATHSMSSDSPFAALPELAVWCPVKWTSTSPSHFSFDALNVRNIICIHQGIHL